MRICHCCSFCILKTDLLATSCLFNKNCIHYLPNLAVYFGCLPAVTLCRTFDCSYVPVFTFIVLLQCCVVYSVPFLFNFQCSALWQLVQYIWLLPWCCFWIFVQFLLVCWVAFECHVIVIKKIFILFGLFDDIISSILGPSGHISN